MLTEDPFFLFLGGFVLASLLEYSTGMFFEKVYKKKLWDYSRFRYNVGGYICLPFSLLWGALSVVTVMFADPYYADFLTAFRTCFPLYFCWCWAGCSCWTPLVPLYLL